MGTNTRNDGDRNRLTTVVMSDKSQATL